ncbi:MAG: hypothetical protein JKX69_06600 [Rhodobacteraceae bacterium]|nr:hypothetical protein [Paracoccaceae bacterium]
MKMKLVVVTLATLSLSACLGSSTDETSTAGGGTEMMGDNTMSGGDTMAPADAGGESMSDDDHSMAGDDSMSM